MKSTYTKDPATAIFEASPWSPGERIEAPARTIRVQITREHVEEARWRRFQDPISIALRDHLKENACAHVFWNSDSFAPPRLRGRRPDRHLHREQRPGERANHRGPVPPPPTPASNPSNVEDPQPRRCNLHTLQNHPDPPGKSTGSRQQGIIKTPHPGIDHCNQGYRHPAPRWPCTRRGKPRPVRPHFPSGLLALHTQG